MLNLDYVERMKKITRTISIFAVFFSVYLNKINNRYSIIFTFLMMPIIAIFELHYTKLKSKKNRSHILFLYFSIVVGIIVFIWAVTSVVTQ